MPLPKLKTATIAVARLENMALTIRELSGKDVEAIANAKGSSAAMVVKLGVPEWAEFSIEDIEASLGALTLRDIGTEIYKLTGIDLEKNSEPGQAVASTSG